MAEQCQWIGQRAQRYILELDILEQCNLTVESLRSKRNRLLFGIRRRDLNYLFLQNALPLLAFVVSLQQQNRAMQRGEASLKK